MRLILLPNIMKKNKVLVTFQSVVMLLYWTSLYSAQKFIGCAISENNKNRYKKTDVLCPIKQF